HAAARYSPILHLHAPAHDALEFRDREHVPVVFVARVFEALAGIEPHAFELETDGVELEHARIRRAALEIQDGGAAHCLVLEIEAQVQEQVRDREWTRALVLALCTGERERRAGARASAAGMEPLGEFHDAWELTQRRAASQAGGPKFSRFLGLGRSSSRISL